MWQKQKQSEKRKEKTTKSPVNSKAASLETGQNHCPTGSWLQIPMALQLLVELFKTVSD